MKLPKLAAPPIELVPICSPISKPGKNLKQKSSRQVTEDEENAESGPFYPNLELSPAVRLKMRLEKLIPKINFFAVLTLALSHILGIYIAISFIILTSSSQDMDYTYFENAVEYIYENTHGQFMQDVVAIDSTGSCSSTYQPLSFGVYDGTVQGCIICGVLSAGSCGFSTSCLEQVTVNAIPSAEIYIWQNMKLCVQYYSDIYIGAACPSGYSQCGTGICVPQGDLCPITGVTTNLQFTRDINYNPLVNLSIVSQTMPCLSLNEYPERNDFTLEKYPGLGCGNYGSDPFAFLIQSAAAQNVLTQNNLWNETSYVPGYQNYLTGITWNLVGRRLVDVQPSEYCLNLEFPELDVIDKNMNNDVGPGRTLALVCCVAIFLLSSLLMCCAISDALLKDCYHNKRLQEYWCGLSQHCFYLYDLFWIACTGIVVLNSGIKLYGPLDPLKNFDVNFQNDSTCFGNFTKPVFLDYPRVFSDAIAPYSNWGKMAYFAGISNICVLGAFLIISVALRCYMKRYLRNHE